MTESVLTDSGGFAHSPSTPAKQQPQEAQSPSPRISADRPGPRSLSGLLASTLHDAVVAKASELLPSGLSSLTRRRGPPSPPPQAPPPAAHVALRRLDGSELLLRVPLEASVEQLQQECCQAAGVPPELQRLWVHERRGEKPGLVTLLRSTRLHLTSRERLARSMSQWVHFLFLPESVNNEIRGTGLLGWAGDNVLPHLVQQQPGTVQVTVSLLSQQRHSIVMSVRASLRRLQELVEKQTGLPPDQQQLCIAERRRQSLPEQVFWAAMRILFACWRVLVGLAAQAFAGEDTSLRVQVQSDDGREVGLRLREDVTLRQLQDLAERQQGGEEFRVRSVVVLPARGGGVR